MAVMNKGYIIYTTGINSNYNPSKVGQNNDGGQPLWASY